MKKTFLVSFIILFLFMFAVPVFAEGLIVCGGKGQQPCQLCDFLVLFQKITSFITITIVPPVAALMLAIGGAMFFLGGADPKLVQSGRSLLTSVAWGLLIIYGAWVIVNTFFMLMGLNEGISLGAALKQWNNFPCP